MIKAIEKRKLTVAIKKYENSILYWRFTCLDKNNYKNKTNLPPPLSNPVIIFLIDEKLRSQ